MRYLWGPWRRAAKQIDGALQVGPRLIDGAGSPVLAADIEGSHTEAGIAIAGATPMTWVTADAPYSIGLRMAVSSMSRYPFAQAFRIATGDLGFDALFNTQTSDAPYARVWLDRPARQRIAETQHYHFILEGGRCRAWRRGAENDEGNLLAAMRAVAVLGNRGATIRSHWEWLGSSLGGQLLAGRKRCRSAGTVPTISIASRGVHAQLDGFLGCLGPRRRGRGLFTRVRCRRVGGPRDQYVLEDRTASGALRPSLRVQSRSVTDLDGTIADIYRPRAERPRALLRRLRGDVVGKLCRARPEVVLAEQHHVTLFFLGFETSSERLRAGVEIATELAIESPSMTASGPYR